jgi:hypothetical protein
MWQGHGQLCYSSKQIVVTSPYLRSPPMKIGQIITTVLEKPCEKPLITETNKFVVAPGSFNQVESRHELSKSMTNYTVRKRR